MCKSCNVVGALSLLSTRTQNTWRRGLAFGRAPAARILRYPTQNIPTCWYLWRWVTHIFRVLPDAKPNICVTPNANPRRQPVEYRWRWVFWRWGWRWACTFHVVYVNFICDSGENLWKFLGTFLLVPNFQNIIE